jgi:hypothetical protein
MSNIESNAIDFTADTLDIRDLIDRLEWLQDMEVEERDEDDVADLEKLTALLDELRGNGGDHQWKGDWYPGTLINRRYFVDYCRELVQDIGDIPAYLAIDWDTTAENLEADYTSAEVDGEEFLFGPTGAQSIRRRVSARAWWRF